MAKPRVIETAEGIQGEFDVAMYDVMMRKLRDRGWMETDMVVKAGIKQGLALEVGPGPGYLGLEWLKKTEGTSLKALEISPEMIKVAERNAHEYGLEDRVKYIPGDAKEMPFEDNTFDGVFTNGSLHEWAEPERVLSEIYRVLKPGGKFSVSDMRRDMNPFVRWFLWLFAKPKEIRPGLISSINAAYTLKEIKPLLEDSALKGCEIKQNFIGLVITGGKAG